MREDDRELAALQERVNYLEKAYERLQEELKSTIKDLSDKIEKYANRLPTWATALIGVLMAAIGWLAK